jgi:uncharacterized protein (TIGR02147 family)
VKVYQVVQEHFTKKKAFSPKFSLRSLAAQVERSPSFLSRVLRGEKPLPFDLMLKLSSALDIEHEVVMNLKKGYQIAPAATALPAKGRAEMTAPLKDWGVAELKTFDILKQWFYLPILELTTLSNYDGSVATIARRLGLSPVTVEIALRELTSLSLLTLRDGRLMKTRKRLRWGAAKSGAAIRQFHEQMLERAKIALRERTQTSDVEQRLITGITLTTTPDKIEEAKLRLSDFLHELADDLMAGEGTEVYHLAAQLFPLTKP